MDELDPHGPNIYDGILDIGEVPDRGTPVEVALDIKVKRPDELQRAIDSGDLDEIANSHGERNKAVGFRFKTAHGK